MAKKAKKKTAPASKLQETIDRINARYDESDSQPVVQRASDLPEVDLIPFGIPTLDAKVQVARGRVTVVWGPESSGKTSLAMRAIAEAQKLSEGSNALLIDAENSFDAVWYQKQGVDLGRLIRLSPGPFESRMQDAIDLLKTGEICICVVDSVHALARMADIQKAKTVREKTAEGEKSGPKTRTVSLEEESRMGGHGAILSKFFRVIVGLIAKQQVALVMIGQARDNLDSTSRVRDILTGGRALRHYAAATILVTRRYDASIPKIDTPDGDSIPIGFLTRLTLTKTKLGLGTEGEKVDVRFLFGIGPDVFEANIQQGLLNGWIHRAGSWFTIAPGSAEAVRLQGWSSVVSFFQERQDWYTWLLENVSNRYEDVKPAAPEAEARKRAEENEKLLTADGSVEEETESEEQEAPAPADSPEEEPAAVFACEPCKRTFKNKRALSAHIRFKHPEE
jgi:recombination protein RecA